MDLTDAKERVPARFDRVAGAYDGMTGLNPGYARHLAWSAERLGLAPDARILDLCCGTGASTLALRATYPEAHLSGLDASPGMLARARAKPALAGVDFLLGDAMDPAAAGATGPYDGVLMAYGIRNVPDPDLCLRRVRDLLAPGGVACFHEYSIADSLRSRAVWSVVSSAIILPTALALSGHGALFRYLRRSVAAFDGARAFEQRLARAGFVDVRTAPMDGWQRGIVHSFLARRPA